MKSFDDYSYIFFWDFKRMDNANYNFRVLNVLCDAKKANQSNDLFNKPIILIIVGIAECILFDFIKRINEHTAEEIPNLEKEKIHNIKAKTLKKLQQIVDHAQINDLLLSKDLYPKLNELIPLRNRIHIQDEQHLLIITLKHPPVITLKGPLLIA